jgi:hypothetical protein
MHFYQVNILSGNKWTRVSYQKDCISLQYVDISIFL